MEIVKKLLVILIIVLLILVGCYSIVESKYKNEAITVALDVSEEVVEFYKGDTDIIRISSYLSNNSKKEIDGYISKLKDMDNVGFDLTTYYSKYFSDGVSEDVTDDVLDPVSEEALTYIVDESFLVDDSIPVIPNDSRIYTEGGKDYVKVKDLVFTDGLTYIDYNNTTLLLSDEDMPLTYSNLTKSKDFRFILKDYSVKKREGCYNVAIEYVSLTKINKLKVDLILDRNIVKDIKIEVESRVNNE